MNKELENAFSDIEWRVGTPESKKATIEKHKFLLDEKKLFWQKYGTIISCVLSIIAIIISIIALIK